MNRDQMIRVAIGAFDPSTAPRLVPWLAGSVRRACASAVVDALLAAGCVPSPCATCDGTGFDPECCDPLETGADPIGMDDAGHLIYHRCDPCPTCGPKRCAACAVSLAEGAGVLVCPVCAQDQDAEGAVRLAALSVLDADQAPRENRTRRLNAAIDALRSVLAAEHTQPEGP